MNKWIKLSEIKPVREGVYRVLKFSEYGKRWVETHLEWYYGMGFQPIDFKNIRESYPIEMDVAFWLDIDIPDIPIDEAESLIIDTEIFFHKEGLDLYAKNNNISVFNKYGNATEYVTSGVSEKILIELRSRFESQMRHKHIKHE